MTRKRRGLSEAELVAKADESARKACVRSLIKWSTRPISRESFPDDFADGFDFIDRAGSGALEAFAGRLETGLASAPCAQCPKEGCPGSLEGCLFEMDPEVLQEQDYLMGEEAEISPFVKAAMRSGLSYECALRAEVEIEIEMSRLDKEMDSIH